MAIRIKKAKKVNESKEQASFDKLMKQAAKGGMEDDQMEMVFMYIQHAESIELDLGKVSKDIMKKYDKWK